MRIVACRSGASSQIAPCRRVDDDHLTVGKRLERMVSANPDWPVLLNTLAPKGHLHVVGVVPDPLPVPAFPLIAGQKSIAGTPLGSPATTARMLEFCARHGIAPVTETFPMSEANEAFTHLEQGKARYRIVLENYLN